MDRRSFITKAGTTGVGAAAAVAAPEADPARAPETNGRAQPRVRLETIFKF